MRLAADSYLIVERALADAFEGRVDFEKLGRRLDLRLSDLVGDNADDEAIRIALIQHAEREDGVEALIVAARKLNGANKLLAAIDVAALAFRDSAPLRPRELRVDVKIRVRDVLLAAFPTPAS